MCSLAFLLIVNTSNACPIQVGWSAHLFPLLHAYEDDMQLLIGIIPRRRFWPRLRGIKYDATSFLTESSKNVCMNNLRNNTQLMRWTTAILEAEDIVEMARDLINYRNGFLWNCGTVQI